VVGRGTAAADFTTNASTALRLQCEYNLKELAFAVEDHDGVNFFVALSLLANLCEGTTDLSRVLLCCGERWRHPFPRVLGTYTVLGDGVGAMLLSREAQPGWRLLGAHTEVVEEAVHPWRRLLEPHPLPSAPVIADAIGAFLGRYQLRAQCVTTVVPPHINRQLVEQVHAHVGFSEAADFREPFGRHGYLCAADPVVRLHDAFSRLDTDRSAEARLLLWGIGLNGTFGSALFARDSTT
jgi:3-oxoacyl-[acyl-carrier-protein] synthase III